MRIGPSGMLVVVTVLWGLSFTWTYGWQRAAKADGIDPMLSALSLIAVRMPTALIVLAAWQPRLVLRATRGEWRGGVAIGALFFFGFVLQATALADTTPALSAFFTSLCSAWAPLIALFVFRERVRRTTLVGLVLSLLGCAVLVEVWKVEGGNVGRGEWLTLAASFLFAAEMLALDRIGKAVRPEYLSGGFMATLGLAAWCCATGTAALGVGVPAWLSWLGGMLARPEIALDVALLVVLSTVLAFHWMNEFQPRVSASRAALIYLLEPVFTSVFSILWGPDNLTWPLAIGGALILVGNAIDRPG